MSMIWYLRNILETIQGVISTGKVMVDTEISATIDPAGLARAPDNEEVLLHVNQLAATGILQAQAGYIGVIPIVDHDTVVLSDGTTTETWAAKTTRSTAFQFAIGANYAASQTNLVAAINADSTLWGAVETASLGRFFAGAPACQYVVYRKVGVLAAKADRMFGVQTTAAGIKVLTFTEAGYSSTSATEGNIPAADPAVKTFGFSRYVASLQQGEAHRCAEDSFTYYWHSSSTCWRFRWCIGDLGLATWPYPGTSVYLSCTGASAELAADLPAGHYVLVSDATMTFIISASGGGGTAVHQTAPGVFWPAGVPFSLSLRAAKRIAVIMGGATGKLMVCPVSAPPVI